MPVSKSTTERPVQAMVAEIQATIEEIARVGAQRILQKAPGVASLEGVRICVGRWCVLQRTAGR